MLRSTAKAITDMEEFDMEMVCNHLRKLPGLGSFTSWQIACDLEEACCFGPKVKPNENGLFEPVELEDVYCVLGPGAEKGLRKIFGEEIFGSIDRKDLMGLAIHVRDIMDYCLGLVGQKFPHWRNRKVNLKVIEHALCEYQKFTEIEAGYVAGQRRWHSRAEMDTRKECCDGQRMIRCDTCHDIVCEGCQRDKFQSIKALDGFGWNCCRRCHALDQLEFVD